jgi:hypothetical protein
MMLTTCAVKNVIKEQHIGETDTTYTSKNAHSITQSLPSHHSTSSQSNPPPLYSQPPNHPHTTSTGTSNVSAAPGGLQSALIVQIACRVDPGTFLSKQAGWARSGRVWYPWTMVVTAVCRSSGVICWVGVMAKLVGRNVRARRKGSIVEGV